MINVLRLIDFQLVSVTTTVVQYIKLSQLPEKEFKRLTFLQMLALCGGLL